MAVLRITKEELKQRLDASHEQARPVVVDVRLRYPYEHSTLKLPGALRLAPAGGDPSVLPKHRDLVLYDSDPDEITAARVAIDLARLGFRVQVLKGGLPEWLAANLPTESKNAAPAVPAPQAAQ